MRDQSTLAPPGYRTVRTLRGGHVVVCRRVDNGARRVLKMVRGGGRGECVALCVAAHVAPPVYACESVSGGDRLMLGHVPGRPFPRGQPCEVWLPLVRAVLMQLHEIHAVDLIHGDIQPGNICVRRGVAQIIDFGAAQGPPTAGVQRRYAQAAYGPPIGHGWFGKPQGDVCAIFRCGLECELGEPIPCIQTEADRAALAAKLGHIEARLVKIVLDAIDLRGRGLTAAAALFRLPQPTGRADRLIIRDRSWTEAELAGRFADDRQIGGTSNDVIPLLMAQSGGRGRYLHQLVATMLERGLVCWLPRSRRLYVKRAQVEAMRLGVPVLWVHRCLSPLSENATLVLGAVRGLGPDATVQTVAGVAGLDETLVRTALEELDRKDEAWLLPADRIGTMLAEVYEDDVLVPPDMDVARHLPPGLRELLLRCPAADASEEERLSWFQEVAERGWQVRRTGRIDEMTPIVRKAVLRARRDGDVDDERELAILATDLSLVLGDATTMRQCLGVVLGSRDRQVVELEKLLWAGVYVLDGRLEEARAALEGWDPPDGRLRARWLFLMWFSLGRSDIRERWLVGNREEVHGAGFAPIWNLLMGRTRYVQGEYGLAHEHFEVAQAGSNDVHMSLDILERLATTSIVQGDMRDLEGKVLALERLSTHVKQSRSHIVSYSCRRRASVIRDGVPCQVKNSEAVLEAAGFVDANIAARIVLVEAMASRRLGDMKRCFALAKRAKRIACRTRQKEILVLSDALLWCRSGRRVRSEDILSVLEATRHLSPMITLQVAGEAVRCFGAIPEVSAVGRAALRRIEAGLCGRELELDSLDSYSRLFGEGGLP